MRQFELLCILAVVVFVNRSASDAVGAAAEVDMTESHRLRITMSRTVAMEYAAWSGGAEARAGAMEAMPAGDGVPNVWKFTLELPDARTPMKAKHVVPTAVRVEKEDRYYYGLEFIRRQEPETKRFTYSLERQSEGGWSEVSDAVVVAQIPAGDGLERVVLSDGELREAGSASPEFRLRVTMEPVPTIFAHYMSDLNAGWRAMPYITTPIPAFFRLFHDKPGQAAPPPAGPEDRYRSTGGVQRDLPLLPPGFLFPSGRDSATLEIRRAQRAGLDGFAVNCLSGETEYVDALFAAAEQLHRREGGSPFQVSLCIDINVLPHEDGKLLVTVGDLIKKWLELGERGKRGRHLARRGGLPLVMGYQSNWIWIDYLHRLFEVWEWQEGIRSTSPWLAEFGAPPESVVVPERVLAVYREELAGKEADKEAQEAARASAVRAWARESDGWEHIRPAYRLLERMVGRELFWQFDAIEMNAMTEDLEGAMRLVAKEFPAVNMFLPKKQWTDLVRRVVSEEGAEWGEPVYSQYVAYGQNAQDNYYLGNFHNVQGTEAMRGGWSRAIGRDLETGEFLDGAPSSLIQYTTWNDYNEHSHVAPSLQMRYALLELTRHFIAIWKTGVRPAEPLEQVFLFYRKYPERAVEKTFPFAHRGDYLPASFEVVTILQEEGTLELLGHEQGESFIRAAARRVGAGLQVMTFSENDGNLWREGAVAARVRTVSGRTLLASGWEEITHRPFRQDVTLAGASSRCDELWEQDAPERRLNDFRYSEYGDADRDGLPNWFEMLYFGRGWLSVAEQGIADPQADANGDGRSNFDHYRQGTNPVFYDAPYPHLQDRRGRPAPHRIDAGRRSVVQAQDFDRGGIGVAYLKLGIGGIEVGDYRRDRTDLVPHRKVYGDEQDAGDWMVTDLAHGEWLTYTLEISPGCYQFAARVRGGGGRMIVELDGEEVASSAIREEGQWSTQRIGSIEVPPGPPVRVMRVRFEEPGYGLNWFRFEPCRR